MSRSGINQSNPVKVHITNLPNGISVEEITHLFSEFGSIQSVYLHPNGFFAFLGYLTSHEAALAIDNTDNQPPYFMKVSIAKSKSKGPEIETASLLEKSSLDDQIRSCSGRVTDKVHSPRTFVSPTSSSRSSIKSLPTPRTMDQIWGDPIIISRGLEAIYQQRRAMGYDGCTWCNTITSKKCSGCGAAYCSNRCQIDDWKGHQRICRRESNEQRHFYIPPHPKIQNYNSSTCRSTIESQNSMTDDLPQLSSPVRENGSLPFGARSSNNIDSFIPPPKIKSPHKESFRQGRDLEKTLEKRGPLRRPHISVTQSLFNGKGKENETSKPLKDVKSQLNGEINQFEITYQSSETYKKDSEEEKMKNAPPSKPTKVMEKELVPKSMSNGLTQAPNVVPPRPKATKFFEVLSTVQESETLFWVMKEENISLFQELLETLKINSERYKKIKPSPGLVCCCKYEDEWYRAKIKSVSPKFLVHFIDYGNTSEYEEEVKELPEELRSIEPLVFLIEFAEGTPEQHLNLNEGDHLKIGVREVVNGISVVEVEGVNYPDENVPVETPKTPETSEKIPEMRKEVRPKPSAGHPKEQKELDTKVIRSILDCIKIGDQGVFSIHSGEGDVLHGSLIATDDESLKWYQAFLESKIPKEAINGNIGDKVLVSIDESPKRATILLKTSIGYTVELIDEGAIIFVEKVYPLNKELDKPFSLAAKVTVIERKAPIFKENRYSLYKVVSQLSPNRWLSTFLHEEDEDTVITLGKGLFEPPIVEKVPPVMYIKEGMTVVISHLLSINSVYIRLADSQLEQQYEKLSEKVFKHIQTASPLSTPPSVGEACCAKFEADECFYRCKVLAVKENKAKVLFVDFGNEQVTHIKDMRPLPEELKLAPSFAIKVKLEGLPAEGNSEVTEYMEALAEKNVELLTINDDISELKLRDKATKKVVNEIVLQLNSQKEEKVHHVEIKPGKNRRLYILHFEETELSSSGVFWATDAESEHLNKYINIISDEITIYCNDTSCSHNPKPREQCLAQYEGEWFRGIIVSKKGETCKVFFGDYGNMSEVPIKNIRKMPDKFKDTPLLAVKCVIDGFENIMKNTSLRNEIIAYMKEVLNDRVNNVEVTKVVDDTYFTILPKINSIVNR